MFLSRPEPVTIAVFRRVIFGGLMSGYRAGLPALVAEIRRSYQKWASPGSATRRSASRC
jgi:hypothetical protein